jgi:hypothetical protein
MSNDKECPMRGLLAAGFVFLFIAAIATIALGPPGWSAAAGGGVQMAGWAGEWSPLGLLLGLILLFLIVKVIFRLATGPRWHGGPWMWDHGHAGRSGGGPAGPTAAFRRWHDEAHASDRDHDGAQDRPSAAAPPERAAPPREQPPVPPAPHPSEVPPAPPWPAPAPPPSQWPYPGQVPPPAQWPSPGQPPQWPYPGQYPQWPYPGQPPTGPER